MSRDVVRCGWCMAKGRRRHLRSGGLSRSPHTFLPSVQKVRRPAIVFILVATMGKNNRRPRTSEDGMLGTEDRASPGASQAHTCPLQPSYRLATAVSGERPLLERRGAKPPSVSSLRASLALSADAGGRLWRPRRDPGREPGKVIWGGRAATR